MDRSKIKKNRIIGVLVSPQQDDRFEQVFTSFSGSYDILRFVGKDWSSIDVIYMYIYRYMYLCIFVFYSPQVCWVRTPSHSNVGSTSGMGLWLYAFQWGWPWVSSGWQWLYPFCPGWPYFGTSKLFIVRVEILNMTRLLIIWRGLWLVAMSGIVVVMLKTGMGGSESVDRLFSEDIFIGNCFIYNSKKVSSHLTDGLGS